MERHYWTFTLLTSLRWTLQKNVKAEANGPQTPLNHLKDTAVGISNHRDWAKEEKQGTIVEMQGQITCKAVDLMLSQGHPSQDKFRGTGFQ